jgi:hypothetical protein
MFRRYAREPFHATHQFLPHKVYRIKTKDDKHVFVAVGDAIKLQPIELANYEKSLFFIDSDTKAIMLFDDLNAYVTVDSNTKGTPLKHKDTITLDSLYTFTNAGMIRLASDQNMCIAGKVSDGSIFVENSSSPAKDSIVEWKFECAHDLRQLYQDDKRARMQAEVQDTSANTIQELKDLNNAYLRRANAEINYRDNIIKKYEENWFIKDYVNNGREKPSSKLIEERTFARFETFNGLPRLGIGKSYRRKV